MKHRTYSLRTRLDSLLVTRLAYLLLIFPAFAVFTILKPGQTEKQPDWDNGSIDKVDSDLFRRAMVIPSTEELEDSPPKIAFMFLVRGPLPLERVWQRFFRGHEGRYSIYVHASNKDYDCDEHLNETNSIFRGRQIPSVPITWGGLNIIRAERRLLAAALADPSNQRFVLLSESCLPIFNFTHVYDYLFSTEKSFVTSHPSSWRYNRAMAPLIKKHQFRKGSQWLALVRKHAVMVVNDTLYYNKFVETQAEIPDESYIQTLIAILDEPNLEPRSVEYVHWLYSTSQHPVAFGPKDMVPDFIRSLQESRFPPSETTGFLRSSVSKPCTVNGKPQHCFLFVRKFEPAAVDAFLQLSEVLGF